MNILLDTCTFLWLIQEPDKLSKEANKVFTAPHNEVYLSSISNWEILVKHQLGRLVLPNNPGEFIIEQRKAHHINALSLDETAIPYLMRLPSHHQDPFDRMLICQAIANNMTILTPDEKIKQYPITSLW
jgi:PIN domain nuclease of toxin-antitoxin system